jgi:nucleotide-binding universal stress UspA family protein
MPILAAVTSNPLHITFIGIVIAIVFLTSIIGVLGWMLRLPKETERTRTVTSAVRSVHRLSRILVPLLSRSEATYRVVALAAQMVQSRGGNVELLAIIEVPFTLPLNARVEEDEKRALELLDRAESVAKRSVTGMNKIGVNKHILKARDAGSAVVREAELQATDLILMANTPVRIRGNVQQINPAVEYIMKNAPCEVLVLSQGRISASQKGAGEEETEGRVTTTGAVR